jgi:hypothetical protein
MNISRKSSYEGDSICELKNQPKNDEQNTRE